MVVTFNDLIEQGAEIERKRLCELMKSSNGIRDVHIIERSYGYRIIIDLEKGDTNGNCSKAK